MKKQDLIELSNRINQIENTQNSCGFWSRFTLDLCGDYIYHFTIFNEANDNHTKTIYDFSEPLEAEELLKMVQKVLTGQASFEDFVTKFP